MEDADALVEALKASAELRADPPQRRRQRVRDRNDDYLVALSEAARAAIVSGDADLLEATLNPPAMTPRELLDILARRRLG